MCCFICSACCIDHRQGIVVADRVNERVCQKDRIAARLLMGWIAGKHIAGNVAFHHCCVFYLLVYLKEDKMIDHWITGITWILCDKILFVYQCRAATATDSI